MTSLPTTLEAVRRRCKRPDCRNPIDHKHPNAKFCGQKCKDRYWNSVNPRGKFAYLNPRNFDPDDDPSWDAHK